MGNYWAFFVSKFNIIIDSFMLCKCNCGEETKGDREYVWGHKTRAVRPIEKLTPCACSCGELVRGKWAVGHCNRKPKEPKVPCECNCGELASPGKRFLPGHNSRTEEGLRAKSEMFQRLWDETPEKFAGRTVWNEGLTKETDERLMDVSLKIAATYDVEKREYYRQLGKEAEKYLRALPPLTGSASNFWKGGITELSSLCRADIYKPWTRPIMEAAGFKCMLCPNTKPLHVHHNGELFSDILRRFTQGIDDCRLLSWDEKMSIAGRVTRYHLENKVSGICLCKECHNFVHRKIKDCD